jgi:hypothetical protein
MTTRARRIPADAYGIEKGDELRGAREAATDSAAKEATP